MPWRRSFYIDVIRVSISFFFFFKILFCPFSPHSPPVRSCIFFIVGPSSCGMWDATSAWFDEQCHVNAQDSNQRNTGPPAAERANLTTRPRGQPRESHYFDYRSFVVCFEIRKCESSNFPLFQNCFCLFL